MSSLKNKSHSCEPHKSESHKTESYKTESKLYEPPNKLGTMSYGTMSKARGNGYVLGNDNELSPHKILGYVLCAALALYLIVLYCY